MATRIAGRTRRAAVAAMAAGCALVLAACGGDDSEGANVEVEENPEFPEGSTMAEFAEAGQIEIGVKFDQPGVGFMAPGADVPTGFDIEMGKIVAGALGIAPEDITWTETVSDNREPFLQQGTVDIVIASYSITEERRQVVGQTGPYYVTGQQILVREEDKETITGPEDLAQAKTCSVTGSTSLSNVVDDYGAEPVPFDTYSDCVTQLQNGSVDAVTTDGAILLGYAAQAPDELEVVGETFSEERYGIGYQKGDTEFCEFLNETIQASYEDGSWAEAFESTLGESGVETPEQPELDSCQ
ncbi:amino acid ABC transporter substrate-binding protein (PAAT family) [Haloactinopolyspora alba]|uniref:Amino acid ABC transporter substrate-binding protein (PAAT family) n=1 Tax=Haloactinopolyspora alba TaxID=648780 RepID=A0A2P8DV49_9ACTN|nr:glutamate ABC transporter substrate-binding protein [Haloactinopolyspora alba]PSL01082.1 amino acid ABC transporter substrate-binding protein (PAAT family) [Haloactinopolyspora alba]